MMIPSSGQQTVHGARLPRPSIANVSWWFDWSDGTLISNTTSGIVEANNGDNVVRTYLVGSNFASWMTGTSGRYAVFRKSTNGKGSYAEFNGTSQHSSRGPSVQVDPPFTVCMAFNNFLSGTGTGSPTIFTSNAISFRRSAAANADYQMSSNNFGTALTDPYRAGKVSLICFFSPVATGGSYMTVNGTQYSVTLNGDRSFLVGTNVIYCATGSDANNARIDLYSFMVATGEMSSGDKTLWNNWASQQLGGLT
jgi:hypothetical protein